MTTTLERKRRTIAVYRDAPVWNRYARWFQVPLDDLDRLHITSYAMPEDATTAEMEDAAAHLRTIHPNTVLIY